MDKQKVLIELRETYNDCNTIFDMAYMFNQSMFTRTEFTRKVANTMYDVMKTLSCLIEEFEDDCVLLTKDEHDHLLEYKHMYEDLCK